MSNRRDDAEAARVSTDRAAGGIARLSRRLAAIYAMVAAAITLVFLPAVLIPYAHHDNARYFSKPADPADFSCRDDYQYQWIRGLGRPLAAEIECRINFTLTGSLSDLSALKALTAVYVILSASLLIQIFSHGGLPPPAAGILALLLTILPGVQNAVMMANLVNALTLLVTLFAAGIVMMKRPGWRRYLAAFLLLCLGFQGYPVWVFVFPVILCFVGFVGAIAPGREHAPDVAGGLRALALFSAAALATLLMQRIYAEPALVLPDTYTADFSPAIVGRLLDGGGQALATASRLWYLYEPAARYAFAAVLAGIWAYLAMVPDTRRIALAGIGLTLVCAGIGILPWSIPREPLTLTRIVYPLSFGLVLSLAAGIAVYHEKLGRRPQPSGASAARGQSRFRDWMVYGVVATIAVTAPAAAAFTATSSASASAIEVRYLIGRFASLDLATIDRVHVVRPGVEGTGYNGLPAIGDEFNRKTSYFHWDIVGLVNAALRELGSGRIAVECPYRDANHGDCRHLAVEPGRILVTQGRATDPVCRGDRLAIVDFSLLDHAVAKRENTYIAPRIVPCP